MATYKRLASIIGSGIFLTPAIALAQEVNPAIKFYQDMAILGLIASVPIIIIVVIAIAASLEDRRRLRLVERLIDTGGDIPPALLLKSKERAAQKELLSPAQQRESDLRGSVWLLFWGLGIATVLYLVSGDLRTTAWSLIFFFLSGANFVNALFFSNAGDEGATFPK